MISELLVPVIVLGGLGLVFGFGLAIAGKIFEVKTDERVPLVRNALPGANCGGCGYPGCDALAAAIVSGEAAVNACTVGGTEVAIEVGEIMGKAVTGGESLVASVHCKGDCEASPARANYEGFSDCKEALIANGGAKSCRYGCIGLGTCVSACQFNALSMGENGLPVVNIDNCTACSACVNACPQNIIDLIPHDQLVHVDCRNKDKGKIAKAACDNACIGCRMCVKVCPTGAITVEDNLARINYDICNRCEACVEKCPTGAITLENRVVFKTSLMNELPKEPDVFADIFGSDGDDDDDANDILENIALEKDENKEKASIEPQETEKKDEKKQTPNEKKDPIEIKISDLK